jgi:uncharacterized Zn finger protein
VSDWDRWGRFRPEPKKAPPADGIKMKKSGTTWWGQRWIEALEHVLLGDSGRLARGRTYARAGRTHDLVVEGGKVRAKVTGSRAQPYQISIELARLPDKVWQHAIAAMAQKAQFSAELLAGRMPQEIGDAFREAGTHLFPSERRELVTQCSCPDWGDPCKHVAATHYVLGEALDRDPFLLFELRGRTKVQVLAALRAARGGDAGAEQPPAVERTIPKVSLEALAPDDYDRPRAALPTLHLSFDAPVNHGAVLRQLGAPAAWSGEASPADLLTPMLRVAAEQARRIALAEPAATETPNARAQLDAETAAAVAPNAHAQLDAETAAAPAVAASSPAASRSRKAAKKKGSRKIAPRG